MINRWHASRHYPHSLPACAIKENILDIKMNSCVVWWRVCVFAGHHIVDCFVVQQGPNYAMVSQPPQAQIINQNGAQHLGSRCVLLSDPSTFGAGPNGPNQNTSRIQILQKRSLNPTLIMIGVLGQTHPALACYGLTA